MGNDVTRLSPQVMADLTESTHFTPEEINRFYREFERGCTDGSLSMSRDEFKAMYRKYFPNGDPGPFADHVFSRFILDDKGNIRFRDVIAMLTVSQKGSTEDKLEWVFDLYDVDRTNYITREELHEIVQSMYLLKAGALPAEEKATPKQITDYVMSKADIDKDGKVSRKEFIKAAIESKTIQALLVGTLAASSSPFLQRKRRSSTGRDRSDSTRSRSSSTSSDL